MPGMRKPPPDACPCPAVMSVMRLPNGSSPWAGAKDLLGNICRAHGYRAVNKPAGRYNLPLLSGVVTAPDSNGASCAGLFWRPSFFRSAEPLTRRPARWGSASTSGPTRRPRCWSPMTAAVGCLCTQARDPHSRRSRSARRPETEPRTPRERDGSSIDPGVDTGVMTRFPSRSAVRGRADRARPRCGSQ